MGGMSTDSAKRKKMWDEDIRVYSGYGFKSVALTKLMKMAWKVPQYIKTKFIINFVLNVVYASFCWIESLGGDSIQLINYRLRFTVSINCKPLTITGL